MKGGARIEVFRHLFTAIAEEMGTALQLSAFSPNIKERLDFSCALFDESGAMLAQAMHIPVHLGAMSMSVEVAIAEVDMSPGDVVVLNDPYSGGSHLPDITLVTPIFTSGGGDLVGYAANRAHHADVGGMSPGSMPSSTSIFQEGLRIPPVRLVKGGVLDKELLQVFLANVRGSAERLGDLRAQRAANDIGVSRYLDLVDRHGIAELHAARDELLDYSERSMTAIIREVPDGRYEFEDCLDDDGVGDSDIPIRVAITIAGERASVDFAGTQSASPGCVNAVEAVTLACVQYVFACLARGQIPANAGANRPIDVSIPDGSLLAARYPSAVVAGNVETSQRVVDVLLGALALAVPDRIPAASSGTMNTITLGGIDPRTRREWSYVETLGGGMGGRPCSPGLSGVHTHMTNTLNTPVEALEYAYPLRVRDYHLRSDSAGAGLHPGGEGLVRRIEALAPCAGSVLSERRRTRPYGLAGGSPGAVGENRIIHVDGSITQLRSKCQISLHRGEILEIRTPGGGGWGTA